MNFIQFTRTDTGKPIMINMDRVNDFGPCKVNPLTGKGETWFAIGNEDINVTEDFEKVKKMIEQYKYQMRVIANI